MDKYDVYYVTDRPKLLRSGLTEQQMDELWKELSWVQKLHIDVKKVPEKEIGDRDER